MSTRACYSFIDDDCAHHVYKHHDGYPTGAAEFITKTTKYAWNLPRFEADEFAASFVAANKECAGGIRLTRGPGAHGDLEFRYEVRSAGGRLEITVFDPSNKIWHGNLSEMSAWAKKFEHEER
jgi:hypothetical protein